MTRRSCLVAGAAVLLTAAAAVAQPPGSFGPGFGPAPQPGQVLPPPVQERLNLTAEQKKELEELQKEVDARLAKMLTAEQKKILQDMKDRPMGFGGGFGGGGGFPPGGFGGGGFGGGFGPGGPGFGGFGGPRLDDVKKQLSASDEEWKVLGPKLQKVSSARQVLTGMPGLGGPGGASPVAQAQADLKAILDDPKHTKEEVQDKVAAVRKAKEKARGELEAAQKDLRQMLTGEQEAVLVSLGYLD